MIQEVKLCSGQIHEYQPSLILKREFYDLKVGDWGLKWEIFSAMNLTVEIFAIEWNLDNYAGYNNFNIKRKRIKNTDFENVFHLTEYFQK